jgi:hypothetical protein
VPRLIALGFIGLSLREVRLKARLNRPEMIKKIRGDVDWT